MAQRSHVPKFGNWNGDNVPYTAYFQNARKEKAGGVRLINPNDPEENPEAFNFGGFDGNDDPPYSSTANPVQTSLDNSAAAEKNPSEGLYQHRGHRRNTSDQQKNITQRSITTSESGSEKGHSDYSTPQQPYHQRKRSDHRRKSFPTSKGGSNPSDDISSGSASVPKFGAWNDGDPKSGEGFTLIFNKVKEEKQIAAAKFPPVQPQSRNNLVTRSNEPRSKMFCCLF